MPLSKKKQAKAEQARRQTIINDRSINGKGYFMDANHEATARKYLETGDVTYLEDLPDYSISRNMYKRS